MEAERIALNRREREVPEGAEQASGSRERILTACRAGGENYKRFTGTCEGSELGKTAGSPR